MRPGARGGCGHQSLEAVERQFTVSTRVSNTFREENVDVFRKDKGSLYWLYRRLIEFRRKHVALTEGSYKPLKASGDLLLFCRELRDERLLIALNMGPEPIAVSFPDKRLSGRVLLSSFLDREEDEVLASIALRGNEGLLMKMDVGGAR